MVEYLAKSEDLTAVADAIRAKGGTDAQLMFPDGMVEAINAIETGSGATDITDSIVSVAFSATNAYDVQTGFEGIVPEDAKIAIFILQGDKSNAVNNKCLLAFLNRLYNISSTSGRLLYCRLRNSSYDFQTGSYDAYDLTVNAGDTFRVVVVK